MYHLSFLRRFQVLMISHIIIELFILLFYENNPYCTIFALKLSIDIRETNSISEKIYSSILIVC